MTKTVIKNAPIQTRVVVQKTAGESLHFEITVTGGQGSIDFTNSATDFWQVSPVPDVGHQSTHTLDWPQNELIGTDDVYTLLLVCFFPAIRFDIVVQHVNVDGIQKAKIIDLRCDMNAQGDRYAIPLSIYVS